MKAIPYSSEYANDQVLSISTDGIKRFDFSNESFSFAIPPKKFDSIVCCWK